MRQPATWTHDHDVAFADLLRAWRQLDDLRRSADFAARSEALLSVQQARRVLRDLDRKPVLAA